MSKLESPYDAMVEIDDPYGVVDRITNMFECLYNGDDVIDNQAEDSLREGLKSAFSNRDITIDEIRSVDDHRDIVGQGLISGVRRLQNKDVSVEQEFLLYDGLDRLVLSEGYESRIDFYNKLYNQYELRYDGETIDFHADYERYLKTQPESNQYVMPEDVYNSDRNSYTNNSLSEDKSKLNTSGLTYGKSSSNVKHVKSKQTSRSFETKNERDLRKLHEETYKQMKQDKGDHVNQQYHDDIQQRNPNQHFSHDDSYGIEEKDDGFELG